ncbi:MAG TPA: phosphatase PAP2 family protein [Smithella sp.]|nr:phosphatase PAP2 family protein [Smithella sp.]HQI72902.1 phosphatase PAP2 family protein [Smithella sp.]
MHIVMTYIDIIKKWDQEFFLFLNGLHNGFFDGFMFAFSQKIVWVLFIISIIYVLIRFSKRNAVWLILALILCVVLADQIASGIIKDTVQRLRPSRDPSLSSLVHSVNGYTGGKYGFVSSHVANTFAFALLSSLLFRRMIYTVTVFLWAAVIAYSRIYLGVHYPLDILGGIFVGIIAALFCYWLLKRYKPAAIDNHFPDNQVIIPVCAGGITVLAIALYSMVIG